MDGHLMNTDFTAQDRQDLDALEQKLDAGFTQERRLSTCFLDNARVMLAIRDRGLWQLRGAASCDGSAAAGADAASRSPDRGGRPEDL